VTSDQERGGFFASVDAPPPAQGRSRLGCIVFLVILALVGGAATALVATGWDSIQDRFFHEVADFDGPGTGKVLIEVKSGDTASDIAATLFDAGVVASIEAFTDAAALDERSLGIQVGYYRLAEKMSADAALEILVDPANLIQDLITIPEGLRLTEILARLADETHFSVREFERTLRRAQLPAEANGSAEGFLFPATYAIPPGSNARDIVDLMVERYGVAAATVDLTRGARAIGLSVREVVTLASIIQKEVRRTQDAPAVAEVIYNRLAGDCVSAGIPTGLLQMDSTVHFAAGANDSVFTSDEMRAIDSPYNTYKYAGLPPGPIAAPGEEALAAALDPTDEGWCYFVAVNLETGETAFARSASEHQANIAKLDEYCRGSDLC
jgi:UPF0755 protein